jgi:hypothetical protein
MRKLLTIFIFFVFSFEVILSKSITEQLWKWKGMKIGWRYDVDDPGSRTLEFRATRKNMESQSFDVAFETVLDKGEYRIAKKNFFYLISHSGGESGGSLFLRIFYPHKRKLDHIFLETSGYGEIKFVDFDGQGNDEVYIYNSDFYGLNFQTKKEKACINLPALYLSGYNKDYIFPRYFELVESSTKGRFELKDVTFTPAAEKSLQPYFNKMENYLNLYKNSVITDEYMIPPIFQYYDYQKKLGREAEVLKKLQALRIQYESSCGADEVKRKTYLGLLLREYFRSIK